MRPARVTRLAGSLTDITETKVADALTGLPNRLLFVDLIERAIKRDEAASGLLRSRCSSLGLDRFNVVNDSLGPLTADRLLVAGRATAAVEPSRHRHGCARRAGFTLARLGGDEFNVLLDDITDASDAMRVAERLRRALAASRSTSTGIRCSRRPPSASPSARPATTRPEDVLHDAAIALHRAKADGTSPCELFDPAMRERAVARLQVETDLRHAIESSEFEVHYQPIVSLRDRANHRIRSARPLAPSRARTARPGEFIPIAEDTGMIRADRRGSTLVESCRQMATWQRQFGADAPGVMCVNVSSRQFAHVDLASEIEAILAATGLEASRLKLEITESALHRRHGRCAQ